MVKLKKKVKRRELLLTALEEYASSTLYLMIANIMYGFSFYLISISVDSSELGIFTLIVLMFTASYAVIVFQARIWSALQYFIKYSRFRYSLPASMIRLGYLWSPIILLISGLASLFTATWFYIALIAYALIFVGITGLALHMYNLYRESRMKIFEWAALFTILSLPAYAFNILFWPPIAGIGLILLYFGLLRFKEYLEAQRIITI